MMKATRRKPTKSLSGTVSKKSFDTAIAETSKTINIFYQHYDKLHGAFNDATITKMTEYQPHISNIRKWIAEATITRSIVTLSTYDILISTTRMIKKILRNLFVGIGLKTMEAIYVMRDKIDNDEMIYI